MTVNDASLLARSVKAHRIDAYDVEAIYRCLDDGIFSVIRPGHRVALKPNWVKEAHLSRPNEWDYVITHPDVITAVVQKVVGCLEGSGSILITDGPRTDARFESIISHYPLDRWESLCRRAGVKLGLLDLRDHEWQSEEGLIKARHALDGDPLGHTEVNLVGRSSEFFGHVRSRRGYYGADNDRRETNRAHNGSDNLYRVSRSVMSCDVFINLPKLKTHKKAGITCCLKNLVGINTYKNLLPHHSEGGPSEGGDQFASDGLNSRIEGPLIALLKRTVFDDPRLFFISRSLKAIGRRIFGDTDEVVRSGNWYGNDTLWRTVIDLNKILLYASPEGRMPEPKRARPARHYIGVVDGIAAGEGNGPMAPDRKELGLLFQGANPAAIDACCATCMGFSPSLIPSIRNAFSAQVYSVCEFGLADVTLGIDDRLFPIGQIPPEIIRPFRPHFGWAGHIEASSKS